MPQLLWDASALAKRYVNEVGSSTVDALFATQPPLLMAVTFFGYSETAASVRRKLNQGVITRATFQTARQALYLETLTSATFIILTIADSDVLQSITYIDLYNLNSSDAAILGTYLRYARAQPLDARCVLGAADQRLIRAAKAEGLSTLNPEEVAADDVPTALAAADA